MTNNKKKIIIKKERETVANALTCPIALFMSLLQILEHAIPVSTFKSEINYRIEHNIFVSYI